MESQELRLEAIKQAAIIVASRTDITDKTKAVFDLAAEIVRWIKNDDPICATK